MLRIIFMGTPQFAVPSFEALIAGAAPGMVLEDGYKLVTVITRPDKPSGRGKELNYSSIKRTVLAHNLPVWQPGSFKRQENSDALAAYHADLYIVAAFGQILPQAVLDQPRYGILNVHASLLPKYRGASPISEAILQGDAEAGVTIMLIDAGIDTGAMLLKRSIPLTGRETTSSLTASLADLGAQTLLEVLPLWIAGTLKPVPQDESRASHSRMLHKEDGLLQWHLPAVLLDRQIRAYTPWPSAYTYWRGKLLKVIAAHPMAPALEKQQQVGLVAVQRTGNTQALIVATGDRLLLVEQLQLEGKKAMRADEFLRGYPQIVGAILGG